MSARIPALVLATALSLGGCASAPDAPSAMHGDASRPAQAQAWIRSELYFAVGNEDEWKTAGDGQVEFTILKRGPRGVFAQRGDEAVEVPPVPVEVVNGLGAGDAFGGALCHGLLAGWDVWNRLAINRTLLPAHIALGVLLLTGAHDPYDRRRAARGTDRRDRVGEVDGVVPAG